MSTDATQAKLSPVDAARQLLRQTEHTRDALPYTDEFERLYADFGTLTGTGPTRHQYWRVLSSVAKKGGWKGRKRGDPAPDLTLQQADALRRLVAGRLGSRDGLPYSDAFDKLRGQFNATTGLALSDSQFWRAVSHLGKQPLRPDVDGLLAQAFDSLTLAVDQFNRSAERGRRASVLIFLDHACEMLLKAALLQRGADIRNKDNGHTLAFESCLNKATDDGQVRFLSEDERATLRVLNGLRDQAQHYLADVSEQILYTVAQSTLTLFGELTARLFSVPLGERLPRRVLPLSTDPPRSIQVVMDEEFTQLKKLLASRGAGEVLAEPKLRSLLAMDRALEGKDTHVAEGELHAAREAVRGTAEWDEVFRGIATLNMTTDGTGIGLALTITKHDGIAVRVAADGEEVDGAIAVRKVDDTGFYCFGLHELAKRLKVGANRLLALIRHLDLQADRGCFKEISVGKARFKMYSQNGLTCLREALPTVDLDTIWRDHTAARKKR